MMEVILRRIPHRPPFLFIDEIVACDETRVVARRLIRAEEPQFLGHYPGNPIMPGVLLCESVFQAAACLLAHRAAGAAETGATPILSRISEAKFKRMVRPGDTIDIEATYVETRGQFHFVNGKVARGGQTVLTLSCALAMLSEGAEPA